MKIQNTIEQKLQEHFSLSHLQVLNESYKHSVPVGSESHFHVTLVSEQFTSLNKVKRHQAVYQVLADELAGEVHALALHLFSPAEWQSQQQVPESPNCMGGSKAQS